ncbi:hypothetical protein [Fictibacillus barbaricus]|uniref:Uncharacterized protein n=1 Tax=Fictibacillus barbaricus TaxID=182136 RepID=A0ABS2ZGH4_9BACL|nr:hypothetical protein [Fictibacillus barbaricus]MBN3546871.1 hypothetical protein [Fictibacillus barbaricus]GGB44463.1 hypothetical protein GCM10007199_07360 [Fictibacillus barbaricus]
MKNHILVFSFFLIFLKTGCGLETKTLPQFYEKDLADVSKIVIVDGNTGYKKTITDNIIIEDFLGDIKDIKFILDENQKARDGFIYSITLFQDDEETFQFGLTQVNDYYYHTEPDIYPIVDEFYTDLNNKEE